MVGSMSRKVLKWLSMLLWLGSRLFMFFIFRLRLSIDLIRFLIGAVIVIMNVSWS